MDEQIGKKRLTNLGGSKKEIILSRSLGADSSTGRKNAVAAAAERLAAPALDSPFFQYTEQDRRRDEDILKRFDQEIGFDDHRAIEFSRLTTIPKKRKMSKAKIVKDSVNIEPEVTELESTSYDNPNTRLQSKETSSDFIVSKSSRTSPARRRIKNTIPSDNFERYLASIIRRYPPMTERDRVMFWKFTPDTTENENGIKNESAETKSITQSTNVRKIMENNNEKPFLAGVEAKNKQKGNISEAESILLTINTTTNELIQSEFLHSADPKTMSTSPVNLSETRDNSSIIKIYPRREPLRRVYGNARQMKQKSSNKDSVDSAFKVPSNEDYPNKTIKSILNKVDVSSTQKEEFYKYLGLETTSPNGRSEHTATKKNNKRRSLRVRQMQIKQETNKRAKERRESSPPLENCDQKENEKLQRISHEAITSLSDEQSKSCNENLDDRLHPLNGCESHSISGRELLSLNGREFSYTTQRRTCGSIVRSVSDRCIESKGTNVLQIMERIDYPKQKGNSKALDNSLSLSQQPLTRSAAVNNNNNNQEIAKTTVKYNTRMYRKNGCSFGEFGQGLHTPPKEKTYEVIELGINSTQEQQDTTKSPPGSTKEVRSDIIEVGRKCQKKHMQQKVPAVISCMESVAYEKPIRLKEIEEKFANMEASSIHIEDEKAMSGKSELSNNSPKDSIEVEETIDQESFQSDLNGFDTASLENEDIDFQARKSSDNASALRSSSHESRIKSLERNSFELLSQHSKRRKSISESESPKLNSKVEFVENDLSEHNVNFLAKDEVTSLNRNQSISGKSSEYKSQPRLESETSQVELNTAKFKEKPPTDPLLVEPDIISRKPRGRKLKRLVSVHKSPLKLLRSSGSTQRLLRPKILKVLTNRLRKTKSKPKCNKKTLINVSSTTDDFLIPISMEDAAVKSDTYIAQDPSISHSVVSNSNEADELKSEVVCKANIDCLVEEEAPNLLSNPLQKSNGAVLHGFYEQDFLIIVQEQKISFWKYMKVIKMFGLPQEWELLGERDRLLNDMEITSPYKNRLCMNENNPVYVEMRAKQLPDDSFRACNMASTYVNIYYFDEWKAAVVLHSVYLDTVRCIHTDLVYTTITNSRYFVMCWKQENITNTIRTGLCKYSLTPDLNTLASIREFKTMRHEISHLQTLSDDKLIGLGGTRVTIWEHTTGDVLVDIDFITAVGETVGSIYCSVEFQNYLFLYQKQENEATGDPQLVVLAVNLSEHPFDFKTIHRHDLPSNFSCIKSSLSTNDLIIITSNESSECMLLAQQPHRLFFNNARRKLDLERFYSTGSQYFVEVSNENLIVKTIHEFLLDFVK